MLNNISQKDSYTSEKHCHISQRYWKSTVLTIAIIMGLLILHSSDHQVIAKTNTVAKSNLVQQQQNNQPQQSTTSSTEPQSVPQILEKDKPIERELKGGEVYSYTITMEANQYLNVVVEQKNINVVVAIYNPDGKKIYEMDSSPNPDGPELISLITESNGQYKIEIRSVEKEAKPGKYQAKIVELRNAQQQDKPRVDGYKAFSEAVQLQAEGKKESIDQAIKRYEAAIAIFAITEGEATAEAQALNSAALLYFSNKGEYDKAGELFQRALTIKEKVFGSEHYEVAIALNNMAEVYRIKTEYDKAEPLYQRALAIDEKSIGSENVYVAEVLNNMAIIYNKKADYNKAEIFYQRSLAILERILGSEHSYVASAIDNLAALYYSKGEYNKVGPLLQRALDIREKILGPEHPLFALSLNNVAFFYTINGEYKKSEVLYQRALAIREKVFGSEHPAVAETLNSLASFYYDKGEYAKAEPLYQRALAINEKVFGADHPNVAQSLNNLATVYHDKGEYAKAEPLYQRALTIREKVFGADHPNVAQSLSNLAVFYDNKGDYTKAEPLYQRALTIREKAFGPEHPEVALSLGNLASFYENKKEYDKAEPLYQRALTIREKAFGPEHPEVALNLGNLALLYHDKGEYAKAEPLYQRSLAIREKVFGPDHPDVAGTLNNLATLYREKKEYAKAGPFYQRSLAIREKVFGPDHPNVALSLNNQARLYKLEGNIEQAIKYKTRADETREKEQINNLIGGSEREKLAYLNLTKLELDQSLSLHLQYATDNKQAAQLALIGILRRKGRALDAMTNSIAILRRRANKEDLSLLEQLTDARTKYAKLSLKGAGKEGTTQHQIDLKALEEQIELLEQQVSSRSAEFKIQSQPITLTAIQQAIPDNAVLIEFAAYTQYDNNDKPGARHYAVYLLTNKGEPLFADLGSADAIDQAITKLRDVLPNRKSSVTKDVKPAARALDQLIMQPVRKLLGDKKRLLISPDGALNLVPFDALVDEHNKYLVEQFEISYLTSGRDLLRLQNGIKSDNAPLVMADPDFAQGPGPKFGEEAFEPLKRLESTADEANQIKSELASEKPTVLLQAQATKSALIAIHRPTILHIATHGFFLGNESANLTETQRIAIRHKIEEGNSAGISLKNPLLRSGLFFANANAQGEDSTLTALEATGLDLWGTKLVVLSACNTGVGEVKSGDGVYGLRRALVLAGSESQMMSLWPVSDKGTKDLMVAYYEALKHDEGRSAGLRKVRLSFLHRTDRAHPYYWASFIQSGEWANLKGQR